MGEVGEEVDEIEVEVRFDFDFDENMVSGVQVDYRGCEMVVWEERCRIRDGRWWDKDIGCLVVVDFCFRSNKTTSSKLILLILPSWDISCIRASGCFDITSTVSTNMWWGSTALRWKHNKRHCVTEAAASSEVLTICSDVTE
jgi:hypothetical protein